MAFIGDGSQLTGIDAGGALEGYTAIDDDTMATASATTLATSESIKAYIDAQAVLTAQRITAWVNFNGTGTPSIRDGYNVSSITDNGTSNYTINFATPMANTNYAVVGSNIGSTSTGFYGMVTSSTSAVKSVNGVSVQFISFNGTLRDMDDISVFIFGGVA